MWRQEGGIEYIDYYRNEGLFAIPETSIISWQLYSIVSHIDGFLGFAQFH
jgi:hypothetical protein